MRVIVYGDLHGCLDELRALRSKIAPRNEDREFCVGDILNKGPKSVELLHYLQDEGILCVRGNHEEKFLRFQKGVGYCSKFERTIYEQLQKEDFDYLRSLPYYRRLGKITILHGGLLPRTRLEREEDWEQVLYVRYVDEEGNFVPLKRADPTKHFLWSELYDGRYGYVVYGHQPFLRPRIDRFSFGIDTGAVYGNRLTAIIFEAGDPARYRFVSLKTRKYLLKKRPWEMGDL